MRQAVTIIKDLTVLRTRSTPLLDATSVEAQDVANGLWDAVKTTPCMGMAAIQLGIPKRLFLAVIPPRVKGVTIIGEKPNELEGESPSILRYGVFVNPSIVSTTDVAEYMTESCVSIPRTICLVRRFREIKVRYQTLETTETRYARLSGIYARVFQHEFDHIEGTLILDRHVDPKSTFRNPKHVEGFEREIEEGLNELRKREMELSSPN